MQLTDAIRQAFQAVVVAHKTGVTFTLETNKVLDQDSGIKDPACAWILPTTGLVQVASILEDSYTLNCLFIDQTGSDRNPIERDGAHARMEAIAKQCWRRFFDLYIAVQGSYQGQDMDLLQEGPVTFTPIYDEGTMQRTGVGMTVTIMDKGQAECVDTYFNG